MTTITLPNGQIISSTDPNFAEYSAQLNQAAAPQTNSVTPDMTIDDARKKADEVLGGLMSPMSLSEIRKAEEAQKLEVRRSADAQFNPQINREISLGNQAVLNAEGRLGQSKGFNLSSAEAAYLAGVQSDVASRIKAVEDQKAAAISAGDFAAIQRADESIAKLAEVQNNIAIAKANYALQVLSANREQQQLDLARSSQAFDQRMAEKNLAISIAQLTGEYDGSPTFAATQAKIQNALQEANLTGYYDGRKTLEAVTTEAQLALQRDGLQLQRDQLAETIRSNRANEAIRAASSSTKASTTPTQVVNDTVSRLVSLRNSGALNDANYAAEVRTLASVLGYDSDSIGQLQSMVNKAMEGDPSSREWLNNQANQAAGSDFIITKPQSKIEQMIDTIPKDGLTPADLRYILKARGFNEQEINASSAASWTGKLGTIGNNIINKIIK